MQEERSTPVAAMLSPTPIAQVYDDMDARLSAIDQFRVNAFDGSTGAPRSASLLIEEDVKHVRSSTRDVTTPTVRFAGAAHACQ